MQRTPIFKYYSLMQSVNKETDKTNYYVNKKRVSRNTYENLVADSFRHDTFLTRSTPKYWKHYSNIGVQVYGS